MIPVGDRPDSTPLRQLHHAVVIGGGIAGLLAARVLSDHFDLTRRPVPWPPPY
jgi:NADPH-dependent 2,4-dienoyl-CoA reductase/sulfur reductase-like enzyme